MFSERLHAHYDACVGETRRRLSPGDRRSELLILGAEVFGQRPYDEVRIDEIAERAGVSRALMYHYFPDKRAFFAAVVRAEGERLFEATNAPADPGQSLFGQVRAGVLADVVRLHCREPSTSRLRPSSAGFVMPGTRTCS